MCDCGYDFALKVRPGTRAEVGINPVGIVTTATRVLFVAPFAGAIYGAQYFILNWGAQTSAVQQCALAGYALVCAVVPYCMARAFAGMTGKR